MEILKIVGIGILTCIGFLIIKQTKPEFSFVLVIVGGIVILLSLVDDIEIVLTSFNEIVNKTGIDSNLFNVALKVVGMGYLTEFGAGICNDAGCGSIADKITLAGKILILIVSIPIITSLINIIIGLLP